MKPAGNHQVQDKPKIVVEPNGDSLPDAPHARHTLARGGFEWRPHGAQ